MRNSARQDHYYFGSSTPILPDCFAGVFEFFQVTYCNFVTATASRFRLEYSKEATEEAKMVKIANLSDFPPNSH